MPECRGTVKAAPDVAELLQKIGKGEINGQCEVTGTVALETMAWIAVEHIKVKE